MNVIEVVMWTAWYVFAIFLGCYLVTRLLMWVLERHHTK